MKIWQKKNRVCTHGFKPVHVPDVEGDVKQCQEGVEELELRVNDEIIISKSREKYSQVNAEYHEHFNLLRSPVCTPWQRC